MFGHQQSAANHYYSIFNLTPAPLGSDLEKERARIKRVFLKLSIGAHPDKNPDDPTAKDRFDKINEAWSFFDDWFKDHKSQETQVRLTEIELRDFKDQCQTAEKILQLDFKKLSGDKLLSRKEMLEVTRETLIKVDKRLGEDSAQFEGALRSRVKRNIEAIEVSCKSIPEILIRSQEQDETISNYLDKQLAAAQSILDKVNEYPVDWIQQQVLDQNNYLNRLAPHANANAALLKKLSAVREVLAKITANIELNEKVALESAIDGVSDIIRRQKEIKGDFFFVGENFESFQDIYEEFIRLEHDYRTHPLKEEKYLRQLTTIRTVFNTMAQYLDLIDSLEAINQILKAEDDDSLSYKTWTREGITAFCNKQNSILSLFDGVEDAEIKDKVQEAKDGLQIMRDFVQPKKVTKEKRKKTKQDLPAYVLVHPGRLQQQLAAGQGVQVYVSTDAKSILSEGYMSATAEQAAVQIINNNQIKGMKLTQLRQDGWQFVQVKYSEKETVTLFNQQFVQQVKSAKVDLPPINWTTLN